MRNSRTKTKLLARRQFLLRSGYVLSGAAISGGLGACKPQTASATGEETNARSLRLEPTPETAIEPPIEYVKPTSQDLTRISLVDTIIPADQSVGAIDLGLDTMLTDEMASQPKAKEWVERMVHSVSQICLAQHRKEFRDLDIDQREQFVTELLANKVNVITWNDLRRLRSLLLTWYYHSEEGAATIGFYLPAHYPSYPGKRASANTDSAQIDFSRTAAGNT